MIPAVQSPALGSFPVVQADDGDAWPPPPTVRSVAERFGQQFATDALAPLVLFVTANAMAGLATAIVVTTLWSGATALHRKRTGRAAGPLVWIGLGFLVLRAAAGLLTGSDAVYFGPGVATNLLMAVAFVVSVAIRRPIVGAIAPIFYPFPDALRQHGAYNTVFSRLTLAWAALQLGNSILQVALLATVSTNTYLIVHAAITWPATAALFVVSLRYPTIAFAKEPDLAERIAAAQGAAARA